MRFHRQLVRVLLLLSVMCVFMTRGSEAVGAKQGGVTDEDFRGLRLAIEDLVDTYGAEYPQGKEYLSRLRELKEGSPGKEEFKELQSEALLANPLLDFDRLLVLKRKKAVFPTNHECNWSLNRTGYDNEIAVLSPVRPGGSLETLYRPDDRGYVAEVDLDFDAKRLLFAKADRQNWKIWEMRTDGSGLHKVMQDQPKDIDNFDPCYLPNGRVVFASTASYHAVPCWHGKKRACNLYIMDSDGTDVRQLCFDQDNDLHPSVMNDGRILYSRWDYTGIFHIYLRPLMAMNPDGTGQRGLYGSNSWWANAFYFPRAVPGTSSKIVTIATGHHGVHRAGEMILLDIAKGSHETEGVVQRITDRGEPVKPVIRDRLVDDSWPKFLHPWPLSEKYFLAAAKPTAQSPWGIYLVDVFDNMVLIRQEPGHALLEPIPLRKRPRPPVIPDKVRPSKDEAVVYMHDVYKGPGLEGVPEGTVKKLRIGAYDFGYPGLAGPDKVGIGGPWEIMRIIGTVPVDKDGSAMFKVPANTPLFVQPLDKKGRALQQMRSWFNAMPGEYLSCVGCHEESKRVPSVRYGTAASEEPDEIEHWHGPPRGFDFEREVQPVLDKYCVSCHDGSKEGAVPDLRSETAVKGYKGREMSRLGRVRLPESIKKEAGTRVKYTPAYEALLPYVRRVGVEDSPELLTPANYHASTNKLMQMLRKGHYGVEMDREAWDRLITWIDLNAPCHGTWGDVYPCPIPDNAHERRRALARKYGGPPDDPEDIPEIDVPSGPPVKPEPTNDSPARRPKVDGWPVDPAKARRQQRNGETWRMTVDLGDGVTMKLVRVPKGAFAMGAADGESDERPPARMEIEESFWMGACEVTNAQFRRFDPAHYSGRFNKRYEDEDGPCLSLDEPGQPVVRVSWKKAREFCRWLSERTGAEVSLPTEAQWEYACRAGAGDALWFGGTGTDFSRCANMADKALSHRQPKTGGLGTNLTGLKGGGIPCVKSCDDGFKVTAPAGRFDPNPWGLYDMHGNAAEWTLSSYKPYPYRASDGRNGGAREEQKVVRGGSFHDRPERCRSAFRLSYPAWQRVFNVGFRVVCTGAPEDWKKVAMDRGTEAPRPQDAPDFHDDFEGGKDKRWRTVRGNWSVKDGHYRSSNGNALCIVEGSEGTDYSVEARVKKSGRVPCVIARYRDTDNYYNLEISDHGLYLWKRAGGSWTRLAYYRTPIAKDRWYTLRLELNWRRITGYLDGKQRISVTDSAHASGKMGLRASGGSGAACFDDVRAK